jgi:glycosyltransferase involved in cell wall biosynthesis
MIALDNVGAVVIGRNEGARLEKCLRSLIGRVEAVVYVDSGSSDGSCDLASRLGAEVVALDMLRPFTAARARNEGLAKLRSLKPDVEYVQFVDGDCEVVEDWIVRAQGMMARDDSLGVVCGRRRERYPGASVYNQLCDLEWDTLIGYAKSCGGDAMFRVTAFEKAGGFDARLIAGEEPELCLRLRDVGWNVLRIDAEMTLHDAAMTEFGQWWRRAVRGGHACAEGAWMHGKSQELFNVRRIARIVWWGLVLPLATVVLTMSASLWCALLPLLYVAPFLRARGEQRRRGRSSRVATLYGFYSTLDKFPSLIGAWLFLFGKLTHRQSGLIEYKAAGAAQSIAYVAPVLPALSETFVYREIFALRDRKVAIVPVSVHKGQESISDQTLARLKVESVQVYADGWMRLGLHALKEVLAHPIRGLGTLRCVVSDAMMGSDLDGRPRKKVVGQGVAGLALAYRLRRRVVSRIHAHFAHAPATIGMYAAGQLGVAFSFTGHANDLFRERTLLAEKLRRAQFVSCISQWHREMYRQVEAVRSFALPVIRCVVNTQEFKPAEGKRDLSKILSVGRLVEKKGFDVLICAVAALGRRGIDVDCEIVGDGPCRAALEALIRELGVGDRVRLLGAKSNAQVRELMANAGLFVLACKEDSQGDRDGIPVALMEAMASGLCVVSGDLVSIRELVVHEKTGLMVTPGDVDEFAEAIGSLIADPELAGRLSSQGCAWVRHEFSMETNVERLMAAFGIPVTSSVGDEVRPFVMEEAVEETVEAAVEEVDEEADEVRDEEADDEADEFDGWRRSA